MHYKAAARRKELPPKRAKAAKQRPPCSVVGCEREARSLGMCNRHYENQRVRGNPVPVKDLPLERRLVYTVTRSGCWEFKGKRNGFGYGIVSYRNRAIRAHRAAYETWVGPIPAGAEIRHKCDNPPCINPAHLEPGSHADNMRDMQDRGRNRARSRSSNTLTADMAREIQRRYDDGERIKDIADSLGRKYLTVFDAAHRRTWNGI